MASSVTTAMPNRAMAAISTARSRRAGRVMVGLGQENLHATGVEMGKCVAKNSAMMGTQKMATAVTSIAESSLAFSAIENEGGRVSASMRRLICRQSFHTWLLRTDAVLLMHTSHPNALIQHQSPLSWVAVARLVAARPFRLREGRLPIGVRCRLYRHYLASGQELLAVLPSA